MDVQPLFSPIQITMLAILIVLFMLVVLVLFILTLFRPWYRGYSKGVDVSLFEIISMRLNSCNVNLIVDTKVAYQQQGNPQSLNELAKFYLANKPKIVDVNTFMKMYDHTAP